MHQHTQLWEVEHVKESLKCSEQTKIAVEQELILCNRSLARGPLGSLGARTVGALFSDRRLP
jgi:hypothetical protein